MIYALAGSHGCGKSTLAKAFAEKTGIPYRPFKTSEIMAAAGFSLADATDLPARIRVQRAVIEGARSFYAAERSYITDRSPMDFAAYLLADVRNEPIAPEHEAEISLMVSECFEMANRHFTAICVIYPDLPYEPRDDRPHANEAYRMHFHHLVYGLCMDQRLSTPAMLIPQGCIDLDKRVQGLSYAHDQFMRPLMEQRQHATLN